MRFSLTRVNVPRSSRPMARKYSFLSPGDLIHRLQHSNVKRTSMCRRRKDLSPSERFQSGRWLRGTRL